MRPTTGCISRYVHLNPVRAKIVKRPEAYPWSSYPYYLRQRSAPDWLESARALAETGKNSRPALRAYRQFVEQEIESETEFPWDEVVGRVLLGSSEWVQQMQEELGFTQPEANVPDRNWLVLRPTVEHIEGAVADEFDVLEQAHFWFDEVSARKKPGPRRTLYVDLIPIFFAAVKAEFTARHSRFASLNGR